MPDLPGAPGYVSVPPRWNYHKTETAEQAIARRAARLALLKAMEEAQRKGVSEVSAQQLVNRTWKESE
jgi:hypothetical protein